MEEARYWHRDKDGESDRPGGMLLKPSVTGRQADGLCRGVRCMHGASHVTVMLWWVPGQIGRGVGG
jgi:hypothetical protein